MAFMKVWPVLIFLTSNFNWMRLYAAVLSDFNMFSASTVV